MKKAVIQRFMKSKLYPHLSTRILSPFIIDLLHVVEVQNSHDILHQLLLEKES